MERNTSDKRLLPPRLSGWASIARTEEATEEATFVFWETPNSGQSTQACAYHRLHRFCLRPDSAALQGVNWEQVPGCRYFAWQLLCEKDLSSPATQKAGALNVRYFWPKPSHNLTSMFPLGENLQYIEMFFRNILMPKSSSDLQCKPKWRQTNYGTS